MSESEDCSWESPMADKSAEKKQTGKKEFEEVKCRFCGGSHFSHACPRKIEMPEASPEELSPADKTSTTSGSKYSVRERLSKLHATDRDRQDDFRVRVSNLTEDATEADLKALFGKFGEVTRCFLRKNRYNNGNVGSAFINFVREADALKACEKLNGHPYGHLILSVEMVKDTK